MLTLISSPVQRLVDAARRMSRFSEDFDAPLPFHAAERQPFDLGAPFIREPEPERLMAEQDKRRNHSFRAAAPGSDSSAATPTPKPVVSSRHCPSAMALACTTPAHDLARRTSTRLVGCAACGYPLARVCDVLPESKVAATVALDDSEETLCTEAVPGGRLALGPERVVDTAGGDFGRWIYVVRSIRCPECSIFVGVHVGPSLAPASQARKNGDGRWCDPLSSPRPLGQARTSTVHSESSPTFPRTRRCASCSRGHVRRTAGSSSHVLARPL